MGSRDFSTQLNDGVPDNRPVDNDAPLGMRLELVDSIYHLAEAHTDLVDPMRLYRVMIHAMGIDASENPGTGPRNGAVKQIKVLEWSRVYDLICRWWAEFPLELKAAYQSKVNTVLSANGIAWDLGKDGTLHRVLPPAVQVQIEATFLELSHPRFAAGLASYLAALSAYNDRPQRGRDACKSILDAFESVAKEIFGVPTGTLGDALGKARKTQALATETISVLEKIYAMSNNHFRHGMTTAFMLKPAEVDFVFVSCLAGILLMVRL